MIHRCISVSYLVRCTHQDQMVINYILQGEYLMAEFYSCAITGEGLSASVRGATGPSSGCAMAALSKSVQARHRLTLCQGQGRGQGPAPGICGGALHPPFKLGQVLSTEMFGCTIHLPF